MLMLLYYAYSNIGMRCNINSKLNYSHCKHVIHVQDFKIKILYRSKLAEWLQIETSKAGLM